MEAEALAAALIHDSPNMFGQSGGDFFFRQSARTLIVGLLDGIGSREPGDIPKLLALPRQKLKESLRGTTAEALIDPGAHELLPPFEATSASLAIIARECPTANGADSTRLKSIARRRLLAPFTDPSLPARSRISDTASTSPEPTGVGSFRVTAASR